MKLTVILLTAGFLNVAAKGISQNINFSGKDVSLLSVFSSIEKQTDFVFLYGKAVLESARPVSIDAQNVKLTVFLSEIFKSQPLEYLIEGKSIFVSPRPSFDASSDHPPHFSGEDELMFTLIRGRILDDEGKPLAGASVTIKTGTSATIKNNKRSGVTDAFGFFTLNVADGDILTVSYIGYQPKDVKITSSILSEGTLSLTLSKAISPLDETQVIAYGKTSRRYSTGSISTVKGEDIQRQPVMNVLQALEGRVPGLNMTPITGNSAAPIKINIRGRNSLNPNALTEPLYVIDGIPQGALNVSTLMNNGVNTGSVQAGLTHTEGESPLLF